MSDFNTHGGFFSPKGYMKVEAGGSHEENPNGGVQIGMDAQGIPNLLEEGEPVYNDYVFSDNIKANGGILKKHNIPEKYAKLFYSDVAGKFMDEAEERPNDFISNNGLEAMLNRLADAQEEQKQIADARKLERMIARMTPEEQEALAMEMGMLEQGNEEAYMHQEEMMFPEDAMMQEQLMQGPQQAPLMARCGGAIHRFDGGGPAGEGKGGAYLPGYDDGTTLDLYGGLLDPVVATAYPGKSQAWVDAETSGIKKRVAEGMNQFVDDAYDTYKHNPAARVIVNGMLATAPVAAPAAEETAAAAGEAAKKIQWGKLLTHAPWDPSAVWRYVHPGNGWGKAGKIAAGVAHDAGWFGMGLGRKAAQGISNAFGKNPPPDYNQYTPIGDEEVYEDVIIPTRAKGGPIARKYDGLTYPTGALIRTNYAKTLPKIVAPAVTNSGSTIDRDLSDIRMFTPGDIGYYYLTQGRYPAEQNVTTQLTSETDEIDPSRVTDYRLPVARVQGSLKPMPSITGSATTSFGGFTSPSFGLYTPGDVGYYYLTHGRYPATEPVTRTELVSTPDEELDAPVVTANRLTGNKWVDNPNAQLVWPEQRLRQNGEIDPAVVTEEYIPYLGELEEAVAIGNRPTKPATATSVTTSTNSTTGSPAQPSPVSTVPSVADTVASTSPAAVGLNRNAILDAAIKIASGVAPAVSSSSSVSQPESGSGSAVLMDPDTGEPAKTTGAATLAPLSVLGKNMGAIGAAGRAFYNMITPPTVFPEQMIRPAYIDERYTFQPLRYVSSDPNLTTNALLANAARQDRLAGNSGYGPSAGIVRRANMNATNSALGVARAQDMLANEQNRNNIISANNTGYAQEAAYNSGIDQFNAQAAMNTNIRNVQNEMLRRRYNDAAETAQYQAVGNELQNLEDQIVANARQRFIVNQLRSNPALYQLAALNGFNVYNVGANGGLLLKKPKK